MNTNHEIATEEDPMTQEVLQASELATELRRMGAKEFFEQVPNIKDAFQEPERILTCIDEGVTEGLHIAGSGILVEDRAELVQMIKDQGITGITTHEGCGAAKLAATKAGESDAAAFAEKFAAEVAAEAGIPVTKHIPASEMERAIDLHDAEICYVDCTGRFNRKGLALPSGFVSSRAIVGAEVTKHDAYLAATIAHGSHGKGEFFTDQNPFLIIVLGNPRETKLNYETVKQELISAADLGPGNVAIEGFDVPEEWLGASEEQSAA